MEAAKNIPESWLCFVERQLDESEFYSPVLYVNRLQWKEQFGQFPTNGASVTFKIDDDTVLLPPKKKTDISLLPSCLRDGVTEYMRVSDTSCVFSLEEIESIESQWEGRLGGELWTEEAFVWIVKLYDDSSMAEETGYRYVLINLASDDSDFNCCIHGSIGYYRTFREARKAAYPKIVQKGLKDGRAKRQSFAQG